MVWTRKKIEFINHIAKNWGGIVQEKESRKCYAPGDSEDLIDLARCQSLKFEDLKNNKELVSRLRKRTEQQSLHALKEQKGTVKFWNDALLKEVFIDMQLKCNNTNKFECDVRLRNNTGQCLIKWDCSQEEWETKLCN